VPVIDAAALIEERGGAIREAHRARGVERAQLDLSGGVDSAVMAGLLVHALGAERITLVHSRIDSSPTQTERARAVARGLGCPLSVIDLSDLFDRLVARARESLAEALGRDYLEGFVDPLLARDPTVLGSIRSTLRAPVGRAFNRMTGGGLRHGTGNECEDRFLRFFQKGGDGEVDSNPIAMLSKVEVYQLAFAVGRRFDCAGPFRAIIEAVPSPDLWGTGDGHSDEAELLAGTGVRFTYGRIDPETGRIRSVGTIERVARFLDEPTSDGAPVESLLFDDGLSDLDLDRLLERARASTAFAGVEFDLVEKLVRAARRVERITRHKANPNCPTYGRRADLLARGVLTDDLTFPG
jgi:NH3-dependent NAD+ synthetase